jgi:hypothetical protein
MIASFCIVKYLIFTNLSIMGHYKALVLAIFHLALEYDLMLLCSVIV